MNIHEAIHAQLLAQLQQMPASETNLNNALRLLAKYRCALMQNTLVHLHGTEVMAGPFAGMAFVAESAEGCHVPKLLGCYEEELQPFLTTLPQAGYDAVLNIGCAEGYYAVGIKRLLPDTPVFAYDINPAAQQACHSLAEKNGVSLTIDGRFEPSDFARFADLNRVLVWCDIEGAERELLDPVAAPSLQHMDLVVEFHAMPQGQTFNEVVPRFNASHDIEVLLGSAHRPRLPPFLQQLGHLDQLLAQWEWRSTPTPWAIMRAKR